MSYEAAIVQAQAQRDAQAKQQKQQAYETRLKELASRMTSGYQDITADVLAIVMDLELFRPYTPEQTDMLRKTCERVDKEARAVFECAKAKAEAEAVVELAHLGPIAGMRVDRLKSQKARVLKVITEAIDKAIATAEEKARPVVQPHSSYESAKHRIFQELQNCRSIERLIDQPSKPESVPHDEAKKLASNPDFKPLADISLNLDLAELAQTVKSIDLAEAVN